MKDGLPGAPSSKHGAADVVSLPAALRGSLFGRAVRVSSQATCKAATEETRD
jgi:hypothetical protein